MPENPVCHMRHIGTQDVTSDSVSFFLQMTPNVYLEEPFTETLRPEMKTDLHRSVNTLIWLFLNLKHMQYFI